MSYKFIAPGCFDKKTRMPIVADKPARRETMPLLQLDVKTSYRQHNNLFEVMEIRCLVIKFLIQITSTYSS